MARNYCTSCGIVILRSAFSDPYLCRDCEKLIEDNMAFDRFNYLDSLY